MRTTAHGGSTDRRKRVCTESWLWEENPLPHRGIEPASAAWRSYALTHRAASPPHFVLPLLITPLPEALYTFFSPHTFPWSHVSSTWSCPYKLSLLLELWIVSVNRLPTPWQPWPSPCTTVCSSGWWSVSTRLWIPRTSVSSSSAYWTSPVSRSSTWVLINSLLLQRSTIICHSLVDGSAP